MPAHQTAHNAGHSGTQALATPILSGNASFEWGIFPNTVTCQINKRMLTTFATLAPVFTWVLETNLWNRVWEKVSTRRKRFLGNYAIQPFSSEILWKFRVHKQKRKKNARALEMGSYCYLCNLCHRSFHSHSCIYIFGKSCYLESIYVYYNHPSQWNLTSDEIKNKMIKVHIRT